jgi:large subunit ribosomal protein L22
MKRWLPRAFGRASRINKRSSHVTIVLGVSEKKAKTVKAKKTAKK